MEIRIKLTNDTVLLVCASVLLMYTFLPFISGFTGAYATLPFLLLGYITLAAGYRQFMPLMIVELIVSSLYLLLSLILRTANNSSILLNSYYFLFEFFFILLPLFLLKTKKYLLLKKLFVLSVGLILITEITTIIGTQIYPEATRYLVTSEGDTSIGLRYVRMNIGGFTIAYIIPAILVVMFLLVRKKILNKIFFLIFSGISFIFLVSAQFTTAILIYLFTVIVLLVSYKKSGNIFMNSFIIVVTMKILSSPLGNLFIQISHNFDSGMIRGRLREIGNVLLGNGIENTLAISGRIDVYQLSLQIFKENLFFGGFIHGEVIGGHSHIIDFMGMFGFFGMIFFVIHYGYTLRTIFRHTKSINEKKLLIFAFSVLLISMLFNPVFSYGFCWGIYGILGGGVAILSTNNKEFNMN